MTHLQLLLTNCPIFLINEVFLPLFSLVDLIITKNLHLLSFTHLLVEFAEGFGVAILISRLILNGSTLNSVVLASTQNIKSLNLKLTNSYTLLCSNLFKNL